MYKCNTNNRSTALIDMCTGSPDRATFVRALYKHNALKFGSFTLKSGIQSPVYVDFRCLVSLPGLMRDAAALLYSASLGMDYAFVCGVPYTALPIATVISVQNDIPMVIRRKEMKDYGTKKMVEGIFNSGDRCLIVEDVITTGSSVLETAKILEDAGMVAEEGVVLLDREQGGQGNLTKRGVTVRSVFKLSEVLEILVASGDLGREVADTALQFVKENQVS